MRYKAKTIAALEMALGSLPDQMRVEVDPGIGVSAKTVGDLRKVTVWLENLAITTPLDRNADSCQGKQSKRRDAHCTEPSNV
jgi:hypothetical protein